MLKNNFFYCIPTVLKPPIYTKEILKNANEKSGNMHTYVNMGVKRSVNTSGMQPTILDILQKYV